MFFFSLIQLIVLITAFDKIEGEIEPDINNEAVEVAILHMTQKHNKNTAFYSVKNRNEYFEFNDMERFQVDKKGDNRKYNKLLNEQNPEKDKEEGNNDFIFLPELLAALQEAIKVFIALN